MKCIAERRLAFRNDENVVSPSNFFQKISIFFQAKFQSKEDAILLVTGFATVLQIANHCQKSCCIMKFCYT